jgi:hypothetical protein
VTRRLLTGGFAVLATIENHLRSFRNSSGSLATVVINELYYIRRSFNDAAPWLLAFRFDAALQKRR